MSIFDITGGDIADLTDTDLRALIARLCEAELHRRHLPVSGVTAGGDQNASDGGIDVRVSLPASEAGTDFIPRANTGFQVKVPDLARAGILKEMKQGGTLKPSIQDLVRNSGAYIIASSKASVSDSVLRARKDAMFEATIGIAGRENLHLDFYDRDRIATWARQYPGIASWIRQRLGKPLHGWRPFENWSSPDEPIDAPYIQDGRSRIVDCRVSPAKTLSAIEGIEEIRSELNTAGRTVRLVGLSGMGKTRLVQALFDERLGASPLDKEHVVYTDLAESPEPSPRDVIRAINASGHRTIVVVDNCPSKTHGELAAACAQNGGSASLITIEYDVGDDDTENTSAFRLEPASDDLIEELIARRHRHISQVDRRRISEFSGGNSRIALALARTVTRGDNLAAFSDAELFDRLFRQRHSEDKALLRSAEACALVYSFDSDASSGDTSELAIIARLAGVDTNTLYHHVAELKDRDLVQARGRWRAVLPHALANRLAAQAMSRIPIHQILSGIMDSDSTRLKTSLSKRLGYLHESAGAQDVVNSLLNPGGHLSIERIVSSSELLMLSNIAPVAPARVLLTLEQILSDTGTFIDTLDESDQNRIATLLHSLAYESDTFSRATSLIARQAIAKPQSKSSSSAASCLKQLFYIQLSGTLAASDQRVSAIRSLIQMDTPATDDLALSCISAMLESSHFTSHHSFSFGARSRDFGFSPRTEQEAKEWFRDITQYCLELISRRHRKKNAILMLLAHSMRGLWKNVGAYELVEETVSRILPIEYWTDGWAAIKAIIHFDAETMSVDILERARAIEVSLRPPNLVDEAKAYIFTRTYDASDFDDLETDDGQPVKGYERAMRRTMDLGEAIAQDPERLQQLLPDLVSGSNSGRQFAFGEGLARFPTNREQNWISLVGALESLPVDGRNFQALRGFIFQLQQLDPELTDRILDEAIQHPTLAAQFPALQCSAPIEGRGTQRLLESISSGLAPAWVFSYLSMGRVTDPLPASELSALLLAIAQLHHGVEVSLDIFTMRLHSTSETVAQLDVSLAELGRSLLDLVTFTEINDRIDYRLSKTIEACAAGQSGIECAQRLSARMLDAFMSYSASPYSCGQSLRSLFTTQPEIALSTFLLGGRQYSRDRYDIDTRVGRQNVLDAVDQDLLLRWMIASPEDRAPALARGVRLFSCSEKPNEQEISPRALAILASAPDVNSVLSGWTSQLHPTSWSGSLADILDGRRAAIRGLLTHENNDVRCWADDLCADLDRWIANERARERVQDTAFE